jgi:hypothetical protein
MLFENMFYSSIFSLSIYFLNHCHLISTPTGPIISPIFSILPFSRILLVLSYFFFFPFSFFPPPHLLLLLFFIRLLTAFHRVATHSLNLSK